MVIKKKIKVYTSTTIGVVGFAIFSGALVGVTLSPIGGLLVVIGGTLAGILGERNEGRKKVDELLPDDELLEKAKEIHKKTGDKKIRFRIERENKNKDIPFLGRLTYGDKEIFEKIYSFDELNN